MQSQIQTSELSGQKILNEFIVELVYRIFGELFKIWFPMFVCDFCVLSDDEYKVGRRNGGKTALERTAPKGIEQNHHRQSKACNLGQVKCSKGQMIIISM